MMLTMTPTATNSTKTVVIEGSITAEGNNQIPIEGIERIDLVVIDARGNSKTLTLHGVLFATLLQFNLLSAPAAVKHYYRVSFDRKQCAVQIDQQLNIKAAVATDIELYQVLSSAYDSRNGTRGLG
ncbi:unnamed protein product [Phytophthora lilii]|uniref:Unnamed protein product n=1 Tax=Phytophthora lilii TaxID=2077276 RepID=A0A9W6X7M1_9STRA|nr:unnamed protein product [Phytophthora lilii]